ncbi:phosphoribosyltransferase [Siccirubricoccus sp. KC 17139]|uniref:Phosphoribosyltransferase n=1 Tax=Siccirubricoccus soli TaxID=2899147 RepID=A0ABT1DDF3_9PROT|nr:phosphoribosyltransferase family protein [Siccirubricoccus soli]MCO6419973.1 phosphoribosyltransferase [Siccirubricoccus soli]MCP2686108.1 phosphoribosyltransferase [Siccirubricoccus soli]
MRFRDRAEAGRQLAARLLAWKAVRPVVFALPRGGVPVALPVAEALGAPLDLLLVRKIGAPDQPELALGAVVEGTPPQTVVNEEVVAALGIPPEQVVARAADQLAEIGRQRLLWLQGRAPVPPHGRTAILVDDGIATGATVRAALLALGRAGAARRVLAVPVAPPEAAAALREACEAVVVLAEPAHFGSVGAFYDDFRQIGDAEVTALLERHRLRPDRQDPGIRRPDNEPERDR